MCRWEEMWLQIFCANWETGYVNLMPDFHSISAIDYIDKRSR